ncbi:MAG: transcription-repair coupling factor, partial [Rhodobiaceae bacterium]
LLNDEWSKRVDDTRWRSIGTFQHPDGENLSGHAGRNFAAERKQKDINLFDAVVTHIAAEQAAGRSVLLVASSRGAMERLETLLNEHGAPPVQFINEWQAPQQGQGAHIAIIAMDNGFATEQLSVLTEQDILGDRMVRRPGRKKAENFLTEASSLTPGDHVVHVEHG